MVTEIELKYSLFEQKSASDKLATTKQISTTITQLLCEQQLTFSQQEKYLSNYYFDTRELALQKNKIALRTRGTQCVGKAMCFEQTIKTSGTVIAGLHQRPEYNIDIENNKPILALFPQTIWQESTDVDQLQHDLIELFSTHFTRQTWMVSLDNAQVEIAFDSGEVACESYNHKPRIYEIELELVSGDSQALFVLTKLLFSQLALRPGQLTKAARGYALYHQSLTANVNAKSKVINNGQTGKHIVVPVINLSKSHQLVDAFTYGIEFCLTHLQHGVDRYVAAPSLDNLNNISTQLALLNQGFSLFNTLLTDNEIALCNELNYFIKIFDWVDNAHGIESLTSQVSVTQHETLVSETLTATLMQKRYLNESQILALLHGERFNQLQLNLLTLLLKKNTLNPPKKINTLSLTEFAAQHLTDNNKALTRELAQWHKEPRQSVNDYLIAYRLLTRALLSTHWFSTLFAEPENDIMIKFTMPWFDIKQSIVELQSLAVLQQSLASLPTPEKKLTQWLVNKSDNLTEALEQYSAKALTMKPYWLDLP